MSLINTWLLSPDSNSKKVYEAAFFPSNEASNSLTLNNTGDYSYFEKGANKAVPDFVMNGTISVINSPSELKSSQNADLAEPNWHCGCLHGSGNYVGQIHFRVCEARYDS